MDDDYGQMYGGEEYTMGDIGFEDEAILDYDDGDNKLDLGSEEEDISSYTSDSHYADRTPEPTISKQEQLRMIHLRSHLNQLTEKVKHHQYLTEKTREEQKQCRNRISQLETDRDRVFKEITGAESLGNTSALYRLRTQHDRICQELQNEHSLEKMIAERLETEEYELAKVEVERGKFLLAEDDLIKQEQQLAKEKTEMALKRLKKEELKANRAKGQYSKRQRDYAQALEEQEMRHKAALEDAERSHERHSRFLNQTMDKLRQREKDENIRYKENMQKKMDMLLKLKNDITSNRENLKALRARDKALEKESKQKEEEERQRILSEGGNPDEILLIRKRIDDFEKQKSDFESEKKVRQASIMEKVLTEEERMRRRKKQQPHLWVDPKADKSKILGPPKKKPLKIFRELTDSSLFDETFLKETEILADKTEEQTQRGDEKTEDGKEEIGVGQQEEKPTPIPDSSDSSDAEFDDEEKTNLALPEFEGLWDQHKPYRVPKDAESLVKLPGGSKMDKEILQNVLEKHRSGIIVKQVAAGREFQGCPFYSKPDVIHFKDFVVGKTYKKKVTLTNVSYTVNYCKYINITERLKDFIEIHFDPPGQMSAGLTCEMMVTFKPMINEDLLGEVNFLSQTGPFSIPLKCTTKKCDLSTDTCLIDFGTTVIGETLKRTFTLTNKGALGTKFEFFKVTGSKERTVTTAATSLGRLTTADSVQAFSPDSTSVAVKKDVAVLPDKISTDRKGEDIDKASQEGAGSSVGQNGSQVPGEGLSPRDDDQQDDDQGMVESPDLAVSEMEDYGALDGMKVGMVAGGELGPFSSIKLEIIWQPNIPGKVDSEFLITFSDPLSESISIQTIANAIDVPVWVARQNVDLRICMYDRLYQDTIIVNNRATTALRLKFEVCKELRNHLELLPKTGYIQAQSTFSAQLKFLPRQSLFEEAGKYFDKETGVLEAPMIIRVADQTQPVPFTVQAVVTTSDMEFDVQDIDFGCCTIYESVKATVKLSNKSILPQEYGFVGLPDYVEVQPNDGFGTLLPLETISLEVIFSPKKARDYKFELSCKSLINREFKIQCKGVGVHPPLEMSHHVVHFSATSLYDVSSATVHVINSHTSTNEFTHPVPRIGKGEIAPVGPTSFEFVVPEDAPLTISPSVGTIEPGKKCPIQVRFSPELKESDIKKEAVRIATKALEAQAELDYQEKMKREKEEADLAQAKGGNKGGKTPQKDRSPTKTGKGKSSPTPSLTVSGPRPITPPTEESITVDSPAYAAGLTSLLRQYKGSFRTFVIPCYVASGKCANPGELPYSVHNTLYLEVHCPVVKPTLVVISDSGKRTLDFGEVSLGQNIIKSVTIQNISNKTVDLSSTILDIAGPFLMLNALRVLPPDGTHTILISYTPTAGRVFHEILEIKTGNSSLHITLTGKGVSPAIQINMPMEDGCLDMGAVLAGEYLERTFKMNNSSSLSIDYSIEMESLSLQRHSIAQEIPEYIRRDKKARCAVGTQNNNGQNVFDLIPAEGTVPPGGNIELTVSFAPDHASDHYSDRVRIQLFGKEESHNFIIKGMAKPRIMFVHGIDERAPNIESLAEKPPVIADEEDGKIAMSTVLLTLKSIAKENECIPASRDMFVGCVRTMAVSQKKDSKSGKLGNGEFQFENVQLLTAKGFNMDPQKGMVEAGALKPVTFTWTPPPGHDPNTPVDASVMLTLKGDVTEQVRVMLRAFVVSD